MEYVIAILIMAGCAWSSYRVGVREGAARTVDKLHDARIIAYNHKGDIVPNKFFVEDWLYFYYK